MFSTHSIQYRVSVSALKAFLPMRAFGPLTFALDGLALFGAITLSRSAYSGFADISQNDIAMGMIAFLVFIIAGRSWGIYKVQDLLAPHRVLARVACCAIVGVVGVVCFLFLLKATHEESRGVIVLFWLLAPSLVMIERLLLGAFARFAIDNKLVGGRKVVMIGELGELERLRPTEILRYGIDELARFAIFSDENSEELSQSDRTRIRLAMDFARKSRASEFAVILPWSRDRALSELTRLLRGSPLPVRLYPDHRTRDILLQKRESHFDPYLSVEIQREPLNKFERLSKRTLDIVVASVGFTMLLPLLAMTAIVIKLDSPGPVIFRQRRRGFDNHEFMIWKFRSMKVMEDGPNLLQARRGDDRVTRVGAALRRTSIDELPQLVNVLKGEMSLVGPRPHAVAHDEQYGQLISEYAFRHHVKPGLTGAAQVEGLRGETRTLNEMELRIQRDLWYVNNWSLWLDIKILLQTCLSLARHQAY